MTSRNNEDVAFNVYERVTALERRLTAGETASLRQESSILNLQMASRDQARILRDLRPAVSRLEKGQRLLGVGIILLAIEVAMTGGPVAEAIITLLMARL